MFSGKTTSFSKKTTKYTVNGKEYNSLEEMPPEDREIFEQHAKIFQDKDGDGIADIFQSDDANVTHSSHEGRHVLRSDDSSGNEEMHKILKDALGGLEPDLNILGKKEKPPSSFLGRLFKAALAFFLAFIIGFLPIFISLSAGYIAEQNGCTLHEGSVNPCMINGHDYGSTLYTMGVSGWLVFATLPLSLGLFVMLPALIGTWRFIKKILFRPVERV